MVKRYPYFSALINPATKLMRAATMPMSNTKYGNFIGTSQFRLCCLFLSLNATTMD